MQPKGTTTSPASSIEHAAAANQILTDVRLLREQLAAESTEASRKLSDAALDVVLYTERVESIHRLLALADSCIGHIWARMRANGVSIHLPSAPPDATRLSDSASRLSVC